ncbi:DUF6888 family protein [Brasilonema sp. UFV-L1]
MGCSRTKDIFILAGNELEVTITSKGNVSYL